MSNGMSDTIVLEVESRSLTGSGACKRMRRTGRIPGNVYGLDRPPFKVGVDPKRIDELLKLSSGVNTVFRLTLKGQSETRDAMIKELQRDPVTGLPVHVDFIRVDPTKRIQISVPVRLVGTPEGVKNEGGIVDFINRVVEVECLPAQIPEQLEVDITALHINQHVSVGDLSFAEDVEVLDDPAQIIAAVSAPRVEEVAAPEEEEEVAAPEEGEEPEVAKKGKEAADDAAASDSEAKKKEG
jgi:large subunit ribosomal protein L25